MSDSTRELIAAYDEAWNRQDLDALCAFHTDDVVFENHTAGERAEGAAAVRAHIGGIFERWPSLRFQGRRLYVAVQKNLKAFGGYVLADTFQAIVEVPEYPKMLRILQNGALLAASGDHKVPVIARDIPGVRYEIGRVLPGQIQHLVTQSSGEFARPRYQILCRHDLTDQPQARGFICSEDSSG